MRRIIVIGDIHGGLRGLVQLLNRLQLKPSDQLIFLGDYVDGWSESAQVIQYLIELSESNDCVFIKGNHDVWCQQWLGEGVENQVWLDHGGRETKASYQSFTNTEKEKHFKFIKSMPLYFLDPKNRLFIHAGFTSMHGVDYEPEQSTFYYDRTLWEMALAMDKTITSSSVFYPNRLKHYYEIFIGHTPTTRYNSSQPMHLANLWNMDTGAAFTGKLSAMDIDSKTIYQSDALIDLYPDELGRNR